VFFGNFQDFLIIFGQNWTCPKMYGYLGGNNGQFGGNNGQFGGN